MKRNYQHYILWMLFPVMSLTFMGCDDEKEEIVSYPETMEIAASSNGTVGGEGGRIQLLVNSNVDYHIDIDVDWITPVVSRSSRPVNGSVEFNVARYDMAATREPRVGNIVLSASGLQPQKYTVSQTPDDVYRFEITGVSADRIPAGGGMLEVSVDANIEAGISVSHPEWITQKDNIAGRYRFEIAENTVAEPRQGSVVFSTLELGDFKVEFIQEPYVEPGGISTPEQFMQFAAAVNAGESLEQWTGDNGEIVLLTDIDMAGLNWTPVGHITSATISYTAAEISAGKPFKGKFNGNGHTIRNLVMETDKGPCFGLFGACEDAEIRNLIIDSSCTLKIDNENLTSGAAYGFVAGLALRTTFDNITVAGRVLPSVIWKEGKTGYLNCVAGIAGYVKHSTLRDCVFSGTIDKVRSNVYHNSACSNVAGIVGYAFGSKDALINIERCVNRGYVSSRTNRTAGIVSGSNGSYVIRECRNEGVVHGSSAEAKGAGWTGGVRVGGILAFALCKSTDGTTAEIAGCENTGTVLCDGDEGSVTGGILGVPRHHKLVSATNSGTVIATGGGNVGLITGVYAYGDKPLFETAACGGRIAYEFTGEGLSIAPVNPIVITAENYADYAVGSFTGKADGSWSNDKLTFIGH